MRSQLSFERPNIIWALTIRANVYFMLGQHDNALNDINKSLEIKPNDAIALSSKVYVYLKLGQYDNALNDLNQSLEINPNDAITLSSRGYVYLKLGQYNHWTLNRMMQLHGVQGDMFILSLINMTMY